MSNVRGRIAVDVLFTDSTTSSDEQSLKTITLQDATEYTTGKVAIVTGTCGTAAVTVWDPLNGLNPQYRNAAGNAVQFSTVDRIAFQAEPNAVVRGAGTWDTIDLTSTASRVSISDRPQFVTPQGGGALTVQRVATAGTASYTLVLYGT